MAPPQYTKMYLGHYATITDNVIDLGGSKLVNIDGPSNSSDAVNKNYCDTAIAGVNSNIVVSNLDNKEYTDNKVKDQKDRIDAILDGSTGDLNQFKEIVTLVNSLDATQATDILTKTSTLNTNLSNEVSRATTAESTIIRKAEISMDILPVPSIYADGDQPTVMPTHISTNTKFTGCDGFYYRNMTLGKKINWYLPNTISLKGSDIVNIIFNATLFSTVSPPFITIYTAKQGVNDLGSWFHSRVTYIVWDNSQLVSFKDYQFTTSSSPAVVEVGKTAFSLTIDPFSSLGTLEPNDTILAISIGTNSAAAVGDVEFIADRIKLVSATGTFVYNFSSLFTEISSLKGSLAGNNLLTTNNLNSEVARAEAAEAALASTATSNYNTLNTAIVSEASLARTNESGLQSGIDAEITRATGAETVLNNKIIALQAKLDSMYAFLVNGDSSLPLVR